MIKRILIFLSIIIFAYFSLIGYFNPSDNQNKLVILSSNPKRTIATENWNYEIYNNGKKEKIQGKKQVSLFKNKEKLRKVKKIVKKETKNKFYEELNHRVSFTYNKKSRLIKAENNLGSGEINSPFYDSYNLKYSLMGKKYYLLFGLNIDKYKLNNTENNDFIKTNLDLYSYKIETAYFFNKNSILGINLLNEDFVFHKINSNYKFLLYKENISHLGIFYMYKKRLSILEFSAKFAYNKSIIGKDVNLDRKKMTIRTKNINKQINPFIDVSYFSDNLQTKYYRSEEKGLILGAGIEINF
jgi:hypothetical protein